MAEDYKVERGDCLSSIAYTHGFYWETIWNDAGNADLKQKRTDPNILLPGDIVHIPDLRPKDDPKASEARYKYQLKGTPAKLRLRMMQEKKDPDNKSSNQTVSGDESKHTDPDYKADVKQIEPRKNVPYQLTIDGTTKTGKTDGDGRIEVVISPDASEAVLVLNPNTQDEETLRLTLGGIDPIDTNLGLRERLCNLGFLCEMGNAEMTPDLETALSNFQEANSLQVTGKATDETKSKLKDMYGS